MVLDASALAPPYPVYLQNGQNRDAILARMVSRLQGTIVDLSEGSWEMDWLLLQVQELLLFPDALWHAVRSSFMLYPECSGVLVDYKGAEESIGRALATPALVTLTFTAPAGTTIPAGTRVGAATSPSGTAVVFDTQVAVTVAWESSTVNVSCVAETRGPSGNVPANSLTILLDPIPGVAVSVTNPAPSAGGRPMETDASVKDRYFDSIRNRGTSGNPAQWRSWALSVAGVGAVAVGRTPAGAGSVALSLLGDDGNPATDAVVLAVTNYIMGTGGLPGVASIGPTDVQIYAAPVIPVDVHAVVTYDVGTDVPAVRSAIATGLNTYFRSLNFNQIDSSIHPDQVGVVISQAAGVAYYDISTLRVANSTITVDVPWNTIVQLRTLNI